MGWAWYQYLSLCCGGTFVAAAGFVLFKLFFALPGGILVVPPGVEYMAFWREIMDERARVRGRITKKLVLWVGFSMGLVIVGATIWLIAF